MTFIDVRDVVNSIINNKKRYYCVSLNEFKIIYQNRAYLDLIEREITFFSFIKNELTERYNVILFFSVLLTYLPLQLYINNYEIIKIIMDSMLIFVSIFFSVFLSFITMYGIESAKKMSKISLY